MKLKGIISLTIVVLIFLSSLMSCNTTNDLSASGTTDSSDAVENQSNQLENAEKYLPNPDPILEEINESAGNAFGIMTETEYDQIVLQSMKEVYSLSEDTFFGCDVENQHLGHAFQLYWYTYIDKYVDGEWVRQCNTLEVDEAEYGGGDWSIVGSQDGIDQVIDTRRSISINRIYPAVTPGKYRFVLFTPVGAFYEEFEVVE